jgi:hypothetical protein
LGNASNDETILSESLSGLPELRGWNIVTILVVFVRVWTGELIY